MPYDESKARLFARPLTHPDVAHLEAIIEDNKRSCASIDRIIGTPHAYKRLLTKKAIATPHDIAVSNPILRKLLRDMQK